MGQTMINALLAIVLGLLLSISASAQPDDDVSVNNVLLDDVLPKVQVLLDDVLPKVQVLLDDVLPKVQALLAVGEYQQAIDRARSALQQQEQPDLWLALAAGLVVTGQLQQAEQAYQQASGGLSETRLAAELGLALLAEVQGEREQAVLRFEGILAAVDIESPPAAQVAAAHAAWRLGATDPSLYQQAVRLFNRAISQDPDAMANRVALGELLLEKYNNREAQDVFEEALALDPEYPTALLGLARSQHFDHSADALNTVKRALVANPNLVPARVFMARLLAEAEQYDAAEQELEAALAVNPVSLQALALRAAVSFLRNDEKGYQASVDQVLALNPRYAELYNTLSELAARNRLYREALVFAEQAVALDAQSWRGYGFLGMNQLRLGEMALGRANLERAFSGDPYNVWIKNSLDLADTFAEYQLIDNERFRLMVHDDEVALLLPYLQDVTERAYDYFSRRYDYRPAAPIRVELYPSHADFSVRTVGLAGIGILGVAFGPLVAMDSPSARRGDPYNWGATLWHELAHAFHLGLSDNRLPRWFAEGLAVYEERRSREGWGGDVDPEFLRAYRAGMLPPVSDLNSGFVRPRYPEQVVHSYYLASLVFEFIDRDWGFEVMPKMLDGFQRRLSTTEVIEQTLALSMEQFDQAFDGYVRERFAQALFAVTPTGRFMEAPGNPDELVRRAQWSEYNYALQLEAGRLLLQRGELEQAETFLRRAKDLMPEYADADSAYWYLAELYERMGAPARVAFELQQMIAINSEHFEAHWKLAKLHSAFYEPEAAIDVLERAVFIAPFDIQLHQRLAELYAEMEQWPRAVRERTAVITLDPVDKVDARYQLANAQFRSGQADSARHTLLSALEMAPNYDQGLDLLLEIRALRGNSSPLTPK